MHFGQTQLVPSMAGEGIMCSKRLGHLLGQTIVQPARTIDVGQFLQLKLGLFSQFRLFACQISRFGIGLARD